MERKATGLRNYQGYIILAVIFICSLIFYKGFVYNNECGDLALKVEASRLQSQGKDAYFFTEANGNKVINGVTSTPFLHTLLTPLTYLNSCSIKQASFWGNFILLFLCLFFAGWLLKATAWPRAYILGAIVALIFVFSRPFYSNIRFGQVYVLYAMLFFLLLYLFKNKHYLLLGIVWALAIAIRPIFLAGGIMALLYFNRKIFTGLFIGGAVFVIITLISGTVGNWKSYSAAMKSYVYEMPVTKGVSKDTVPRHVIADGNTYSDCTATLSPWQTKAREFVLKTGTLFPSLQIWLLDRKINITNVTFFSALAMVFSLILAIAVKLRLKDITAEKFILTLFILYIICEICVPAPRIRYSTILWLFGVGLIIAKGNFAEVAIMVIGQYFFFNYHHHLYQYAELLLLTPCFMYLFRKSETPYYINWFKKYIPGVSNFVVKPGLKL